MVAHALLWGAHMRTRPMMVACALSMAACDVSLPPDFLVDSGFCLDFGPEPALAIADYERSRAIGRPDEALRTNSGQLWVNGNVDAGRLYVTFLSSPQSEALPRVRSDGGCVHRGDFAILYAPFTGPGASVVSLQGRVDVAPADAGASDAGTRLSCTGLFFDGGSFLAVGNRDFELALP
jgi:hypothetical protein